MRLARNSLPLSVPALALSLGASPAHANRLDDANVSATCTGYQVDFTAIMIPNTPGTVEYQVIATPVGPGMGQSATGAVPLPLNTLPYGAPVSASKSGSWTAPLVGTYDVTGTASLVGADVVYFNTFLNQPVRITCAAPPPPVCGNGVLESGEVCDDGNTRSGDGCSATCQKEPPPVLQGCTPGYWKQLHRGTWVRYSAGDSYAAVFDVGPSFSLTLSGALNQGGGGEVALARHAVAALLNAVNGKIGFAFTESEVIEMVQDAYATHNFEAIKNVLAAENERGCPLPANPDKSPPDKSNHDKPSHDKPDDDKCRR